MIVISKLKYLFLCSFICINLLNSQNKTIDDLLVRVEARTNDDSLKVDMLNDLAWELTKLDPDSALSYAKQANTISKQLSYGKGKATSMVRIATIYLNKGQLNEAETLFNDALHEEQLNKHTYGIGRAENQLGKLYTYKEQQSKAINHYEKALEAFETLALKPQIASVCNNIGVAYKKIGAFDIAIQYYLRALEIRRQLKDDKRIAYSLSNIGALYITLEEYDNAIEYLNQSRESLEELNESNELYNVYTNLSIAFFRTNRDSTSLSYYNKALALNETLGIQDNNVRLYNVSAGIDYNRNNLDSALRTYKNVLDILNNSENKSGLVDVYYNLGNVEFKKDAFENAIEYYEKALDLAEKKNDINIQLQLVGNLSLCYSQLKAYDRALEYRNRFVDLNEHIYDVSKKAIISNYDYEEEQLEKKALEKDKLIAQQELEKTKMKNYALIFGLFLLILLLLAILRGNKQKRKADREQIEKQKVQELLKNQELKSINAMIEGQEGERQRIARDLHDRLGSMLSMVKVHFKSVEENIEKLKASNRSQYEKANTLLDNACDEVRKISHDIASGVLTKFGLVAALEDLKETLEESNRVEVEFIAHGFDARLDNNIEITIYRIVQELVSNILKYAQAKHITIQLINNDNSLHITVEDDGIGFDYNESKDKGMGLTNVASRVYSLDGELSIDSMLNKGTNISIDIPLNNI
ncbi:tetratricopeptide repeat protein [uncultured Psychroserpens sp.]|uniref:tetratricopeptide repeat-containing sensor histidine kinase n=1 Tax=uncultured Psychroserpens sp. TaxID=255436 RepID=UPI00260C31DA|nr:tetratricopeptide repeat protein [uncultured Psychroserpens sp.]